MLLRLTIFTVSHIKPSLLMKNITLLSLLLLVFLSSCDDDLDDNLRPASSTEISDFVYRGLNYWSLYKEDVPELANDFFDNDAARFDYLSQFSSPEAAFDALTSTRDRFSILRDDYVALENSLAGIRTSSGLNLSLLIMPNDPTTAFGVVRYVVNDSPADLAGAERGMIFTLVDGQPLTSSDGQAIDGSTNFNSFFAPDTYTIGLATYDGTDFTTTGEEIVITKTELTINPVHTVNVLSVGGNEIGYLHYTGFTNEFDSELNAAFAQFRSAGVTDLVLDLRYNGGGSIETANDLSTMITGQFNGEEFITQEYNADRNQANEFVRRFNNNLGSGDDGPAINSLGLTRVFVLTTGRSASASELILSGLDPYIEVIQIGTNTVGKFEGSFLLYDAPSPNFRRSEANPNHRYVMLPLVLKSVNADGLTDYFDGFTPDLLIAEDFENFGQLGEQGEPLLDAAIDIILNGRSSTNYNTSIQRSIYDSEQEDPLYQRMMVDRIDL